MHAVARGWDLDLKKLWGMHLMLDQVPSLLFFAEKDNLPLNLRPNSRNCTKKEKAHIGFEHDMVWPISFFGFPWLTCT